MAAPERFDAVVVGSGFGGAVTACRLAEHGWRVLVLERGRPWPPGSFPRTPDDFRRAFWDPEHGRHGLFDVWSFRELNAIVASGLGGGSLIYANVMLRKPPETFNGWPISSEELEPHYQAVEDVQQPQTFPSGPEPYASTAKTREFEQAAGAAGLTVTRPNLAVLFAAEQHGVPVQSAPVFGPNLHGNALRRTCRLCGECDIGCNDGAKQTLDFTYLSRACAAHAQIRTLCEATTLEQVGGGWRVGYRQHQHGLYGVAEHLRAPEDEAEQSVDAAHVVLAAGTLGTVGLLRRNQLSLGALSPALGRRVSCNGDLLGFACDARTAGGALRYLDPSRGPVITCSARVPAGRSPTGHEHYVQDGGFPAFAEWLLQALELPKDLWDARDVLWQRIEDRLAGHPDPQISEELGGLLGTAGRSAAMMPLLGMGVDAGDGWLQLDEQGRLDLRWDPTASESYFAAVLATCQAITAELGAKWRSAPTAHLTTVHPVGGCAMADAHRNGVVDPMGNVHGYEGLHVADGSVMPGPVGPNPSLTIAALAERFACGMIAKGRPCAG